VRGGGGSLLTMGIVLEHQVGILMGIFRHPKEMSKKDCIPSVY
jgi:hypothetical protein